MNHLINSLKKSGRLSAADYRTLLLGGADNALREAAQEVTLSEFGLGVYVRALIEVTNICRNNCYYCGIRAANSSIKRYSLTQDEIIASCDVAYGLGFRTFVLQGGESREWRDDRLEELVREIKRRYSECAITLSLGEMSRESYQRLFDAGADRYLLRHESYNREHYQMLHPADMSWQGRMESIQALREIGYQVGVGMMVGSPHQTIDHLVEDLLFIERFRPEMVGIGPFLPHHETPFAHTSAGSVEMTTRLISIVRLINPKCLIPSTTALATLSSSGREQGILAGANVVMPNVSPIAQRGNYSLYDNKVAFGSESAEGLQLLKERLAIIGREINFARGDYNE